MMNKVFDAGAKKTIRPGRNKAIDYGKKEAAREEFERRDNKRNMRLKMVKIADREVRTINLVRQSRTGRMNRQKTKTRTR